MEKTGQPLPGIATLSDRILRMVINHQLTMKILIIPTQERGNEKTFAPLNFDVVMSRARHTRLIV